VQIHPSVRPSDYAVHIRASDLRWLFSRVVVGESCCLVGVSDVGLTFVGRTLSLPAVRDMVFDGKPEPPYPLIVFVDCNALGRIDGDSLFLLTANRIVKAMASLTRTRTSLVPTSTVIPPKVPPFKGVGEFNRVVEDVIGEGFSLCIVYDPFDECLRQVDTATLLRLRAARDELKPALSYVITAVQRPETIRPESEANPFTSLFWGRVRYLRPLDQTQARSMLEFLSASRGIRIPERLRHQVIQLSGGHPGLMRTVFEAAVESLSSPSASLPMDREFYHTEGLALECRSIAESLSQEEITSLKDILARRSGAAEVEEDLTRKGILVISSSGRPGVFSPLFEEYLRLQSSKQTRLIVDFERGTVEYGSEDITRQLSATEYRLLLYLARRCGQMCSKDDIAAALWPDEILMPPDDNRIQKAVDRLRSKLAAATGVGGNQYIQTVRGRGYRFVTIDGVHSA